MHTKLTEKATSESNGKLTVHILSQLIITRFRRLSPIKRMQEYRKAELKQHNPFGIKSRCDYVSRFDEKKRKIHEKWWIKFLLLSNTSLGCTRRWKASLFKFIVFLNNDTACALSRQLGGKLVKLLNEGKSERFNNDIADEGVKTQLTSNLLNESFSRRAPRHFFVLSLRLSTLERFFHLTPNQSLKSASSIRLYHPGNKLKL